MEITSLILGASAVIAVLLVAHLVMDHITIKGLRRDMDQITSDIDAMHEAIEDSADFMHERMDSLKNNLYRDLDELKKDIV